MWDIQGVVLWVPLHSEFPWLCGELNTGLLSPSTVHYSWYPGLSYRTTKESFSDIHTRLPLQNNKKKKGSTLAIMNKKPWKAKNNGNKKMGKNSQSYTYFCFPTLLTHDDTLNFFVSFASQGNAIPFQHLHTYSGRTEYRIEYCETQSIHSLDNIQNSEYIKSKRLKRDPQ